MVIPIYHRNPAETRVRVAFDTIPKGLEQILGGYGFKHERDYSSRSGTKAKQYQQIFCSSSPIILDYAREVTERDRQLWKNLPLPDDFHLLAYFVLAYTPLSRPLEDPKQNFTARLLSNIKKKFAPIILIHHGEEFRMFGNSPVYKKMEADSQYEIEGEISRIEQLKRIGSGCARR